MHFTVIGGHEYVTTSHMYINNEYIPAFNVHTFISRPHHGQFTFMLLDAPLFCGKSLLYFSQCSNIHAQQGLDGTFTSRNPALPHRPPRFSKSIGVWHSSFSDYCCWPVHLSICIQMHRFLFSHDLLPVTSGSTLQMLAVPIPYHWTAL